MSSVERFHRFARKNTTKTKKLMPVIICCVTALSTLSVMCYSPSSSVQDYEKQGEKILLRHSRSMKPMIDMRGFPDTEGLCPNAGFFPNKTDCTQFYRCVDFNRNGKHTVFRFMCGPGTGYDRRLSICVWPKMVVPECRNGTLTPTSSSNTTTTSTSTSTTTTTTTTPTPPTNNTTNTTTNTTTKNPDKCVGILTVEDENIYQANRNIENMKIPSNSISGIISCGGNRNEIIYYGSQNLENGLEFIPTSKIAFPSGAIFLISTNLGDGAVTDISNQIFTTNSTKISLPPSTTLEIIEFVEGHGINRTTLFVTEEKSEIVVPEMSIYGQVTLSNNQVTKIGGWSYTTQYITIDETKSESTIFGIISNVTTLQTTVSSNSKGSNSSKEFISGVITVGASSYDDQSSNSLSYTLSVTNKDILAIIPKQGKGIITLSEEGSDKVTEFSLTPGTVLTIEPPADLNGMVNNLSRPMYTSATTEIIFPAGSTVSVSKIRIDGKLEKISAVQASSTFAVSTITQSIVGIVQTSNDGAIRNIGTAFFDVELVNGIPDETYIGVLNLDLLLITTTTPTTTPKPFIPARPPFTIDCASDGPLQFPLDCSRFYQCTTADGGKHSVYVFSCVPGLYFDDVSSSCLTLAETICKDQTSINDTTISSSEETGGGIINLDCDNNFYRYPLNCNNFYTCFKDNQGQDTINVFSCAAGLVFDESSLSCLLPNETLLCDVNKSLFKSPSTVFQLREKIDFVSLLSTTRDIFKKQRTNLPKHGEISELIVPKYPHQSGRGTSQSRIGIRMSTNIETPN